MILSDDKKKEILNNIPPDSQQMAREWFDREEKIAGITSESDLPNFSSEQISREISQGNLRMHSFNYSKEDFEKRVSEYQQKTSFKEHLPLVRRAVIAQETLERLQDGSLVLFGMRGPLEPVLASGLSQSFRAKQKANLKVKKPEDKEE